jgi:hypothetical protein
MIRSKLAESRALELVKNERIIDEINDYFEMRDDHDEIREKIKSRYGVGITVDKDDTNSESPFRLYAKGEFNKQVDAGLVAAIQIGFGRKIINAIATLFTEDGQRWDLVAENERDVSSEMNQLEVIRENGKFHSAIEETDRRSVQSGAAAIFVQAKNDQLCYKSLSASDIRCYWPETVIDGDTERAPDKTDIEDAYAIVIRLSPIDFDTYNYLAIFSRSQDYPNGRWCTYQASTSHNALPEINQDKSSDYTINGEIANPLSYFANIYEGQDVQFAEFPISVIKGVTDSNNSPFPFYDSLFQDDVEFTMTASHILAKANSAASGTHVVSQAHEGVSNPLPPSLEPVVTCLPGITYEYVPKDAGNVVDALKAVEKLIVSSAQGWGVPDYMALSEDHTLDASSGVALEVKTRPLIKQRQRREEKNYQSVKKIFHIERAMIWMFIDQQLGESLISCELNWTAGPLALPENKQEKANQITQLMDKGIYDQIAAIRAWYNLTSDDEAIGMYETMKARAEKYPALNQPQQPQTGTLRNSFARNRQQRQQPVE